MSQLPPIPPVIARLTGPLLIGQFFNWGLFGVLCVQIYIYTLAFPTDRKRQQVLVAVIFIIEALQTLLGTYDAFRILAEHYGDMLELDRVGLLWFTYPFLNTTASCIVQLFYAWRIRVLSFKTWLPIIIAILSLAQTATGIYEAVVAHEIGVFSKLSQHAAWSEIVHLGGTALCDSIITGCMVYYLKKSQIGFRRFNDFLGKLMRLTMETGALCMAMAIIDLALFLGFEKTNYHTVPASVISKLYSNSLLVLINARAQFALADTDTFADSTTLSLSFVSVSQLRSASENIRSRPSGVQASLSEQLEDQQPEFSGSRYALTKEQRSNP
ncbi:unnamed protein product [Somion occarium]